MRVVRCPATDQRCRALGHRDRGAVDVSIQMLFGFIAMLFAMLLVFEAVSYWHARNVFDEAAAEGARVAAAFDGDCIEGIAAARAVVQRTAGSWAEGVGITCTEGVLISVTVVGRTPGVMGDALGFTARVTETAPKEQ